MLEILWGKYAFERKRIPENDVFYRVHLAGRYGNCIWDVWLEYDDEKSPDAIIQFT